MRGVRLSSTLVVRGRTLQDDGIHWDFYSFHLSFFKFSNSSLVKTYSFLNANLSVLDIVAHQNGGSGNDCPVPSRVLLLRQTRNLKV